MSRNKKQVPFVAEFVIDPSDKEFKKLRDVCEPGNPWRCMIAISASMAIHKRVTVRVDHDTTTGVLGLTHGIYRYERPMTAEEVNFAIDFDLGRRLRKPLVISIDLGDSSWVRKPKQTNSKLNKNKNRKGGVKNVGIGKTRSIRSRQLAKIKAAHEAILAR